MAIAITVEDGSGVEDANSYVDPADTFASDYFEAHLYASFWNDADADQRKAAVVQATRTIDTNVTWNGRKVEFDQALQWPRYGVEAEGFLVGSDVVPIRVQQATLEMALALLERNRIADTAKEQAVTSLGLGSGALSINFAEDPASNLKVIPSQVRALLAPYGSASGGTMQRVYRA